MGHPWDILMCFFHYSIPSFPVQTKGDCHTTLCGSPRSRTAECPQRLLGLLADVGQNAAVHIQDQAVDKVRSLRCQEHSGSAQILGLAPAACGGLGNDELVEGVTAAVGLDLAQRCGLRGSPKPG